MFVFTEISSGPVCIGHSNDKWFEACTSQVQLRLLPLRAMLKEPLSFLLDGTGIDYQGILRADFNAGTTKNTEGVIHFYRGCKKNRIGRADLILTTLSQTHDCSSHAGALRAREHLQKRVTMCAACLKAKTGSHLT